MYYLSSLITIIVTQYVHLANGDFKISADPIHKKVAWIPQLKASPAWATTGKIINDFSHYVLN